MKLARFAPVLVGAATVASLAFAAPAAFAGSTPPTPSFLPGGGHHSQSQPEQFDGLISSTGDNVVLATGPVHGHGDDVSVSARLDKFDFGGGNEVNVGHSAIQRGQVDLRTCSVVIDQRDASWSFLGGKGDDQGATGSGHVTVVELISFAEHHGKCDLGSGGYVANDGQGRPCWYHQGRPESPVFFSIEFQGAGTARVGHARPQPCPCSLSPAVTGGSQTSPARDTASA